MKAYSREKILFTFVVPVYGTERFLPRCLDSLVEQTDANFEVIVVDDFSPQGSREIVARYDKRFHWTRHDKNRGLLQARITGARAAEGAYVIPLDSDDYVMPELVEKLREAVTEEPESDVVVYHMATDKDGDITPAWHNHAAGVMSSEEMLSSLFAGKTFWPMCGKAFRRKTYLAGIEWADIDRDFYLNSTEDLCQMLPILLNARRVKLIEYSGYRYWVNPNSLSKRIGTMKKLVPLARQCQSCIDKLLAAAEAHQCSKGLLDEIRGLLRPTIRWVLDEINHLSSSEFSRCVNQLCRIHGVVPVLSEALSRCPCFYRRFIPDIGVFSPPRQGPVKTIAVLCLKRSGGGAERATQIWMSQMERRGVRILWLPDASCEPKSQFALSDDLLVRAGQLEKIIADEHVDTVLLTDHWRNWIFWDMTIAKANGCRVIIAEHSSYFFPLDDGNPELYVARDHFYPLAEAVTVLSPENVAWWHAKGVRNVVYMPNFLTFDIPATGERTGCSASRILFVGRICERKNADLAMEAVASLVQEHPDLSKNLTLTFLGRFNTEREEREARALQAKLGLEKIVDFRGNVDNIGSYYEAADILLVTSRLEGAPMVIMEAKSHGLPTVMFELSYVDGADEEHGVLTVPWGDTHALGEALARCLSDRELYAMLSRAARKSLESFDCGHILARWDVLLGQLSTGVREINPQCAEVPPTLLLDVTLASLSNLGLALCLNKDVALRSYQSEADALRQERDEVWKKVDYAWAEYNKVCKERDDVWLRLNAAYALIDRAKDRGALSSEELIAVRSDRPSRWVAVRKWVIGKVRMIRSRLCRCES